MSTRPLRLACLVAPVAALATACAAPPALAADPSVTITYKGTLHEKYVAKVSEPSDFEVELTLEWSETATDDALTHEPLAAPSFSISGSMHVTSAHQKPNASCTGTFSTRPGPYGNSPAGFLSEGLVSIGAVLPNNGKYVQSSGIERCALAPNEGLGVGGHGVPNPESVAASAPTESFPESQPVYTRTFSVPDSVHREPAPNGKEESENTLTLSATLTATTTVHTGPQGFHPPAPGGGGSTRRHPLRLGKTVRKAKKQAQRDLPEALKEAWAAHGLQALTALPGTPLLSIADELGQSAAALAGNDATTRVLDDLRIYNDPPLANIHVLAQPAPAKTPPLPSCTGRTGSQLAYCASLREAFAALLGADDAAAADDTALERTVSRASAAAAARNAGALRLQEGHAAGLEAALAGALAGKRHSASSVRTLLREAAPPWTMSLTQAASAIRWLKGRLSHSGVHVSILRRLAGGSLTPAKTDVLDLL